MIKVVFLGHLKDLAGESERQVNLEPVKTLAELIAKVADGSDPLKDALSHPSIRTIINKSILAGTDLSDLQIEEVAFMPPLSGG